jgi:hypothetical protein
MEGTAAEFTSDILSFVAGRAIANMLNLYAYNPKSNLVEQLHRDLGTMLRALSYDTHQDWEALLPQALFAIRTAVSKSIGLSPYQLLFGPNVSQPIDIAFGKPPMPPQGDLDYHRYADQLRNRIDNTQTYTREKIALAITRQRRSYNQDAKEINVGEKVWLFTQVTKPGQSRK